MISESNAIPQQRETAPTHQNPSLLIRDRDSNNGNSPNSVKNEKPNFFNNTEYQQMRDNDDYYSKKFAMMIPSNNNKPIITQQKANKSNENPPTYQKCFTTDAQFKF